MFKFKPGLMKLYASILLFVVGILSASITFAQPAGFNYTTIACAGQDAFALLGVVQINGVTPAAGSWVAAFDETEVLAGSGELVINAGAAYINQVVVNTDVDNPTVPCASIDAGINGYPSNPERFFIVIFNAGNNRYYQFPDDGTRTLFNYVPQAPLNLYIQAFSNFTTIWNHTGNGFATLDELLNPVLPVELTRFEGQGKNLQVELSWTTASERNNDFFEVQRSTDGRTFDLIGKVEGGGTRNTPLDYSFTDRMPKAGVNYYRLRQVDFDGAFEYSRVIAVEVKDKNGEIGLFPNPASEMVEIRLPLSWSDGQAEVRIRDVAGRVVRHLNMQAIDGPLNFSLSGLTGGYYTVEAFNGSVLLSTRLMVSGR
jgi:hypothetical protein